MPDDKAKKRPQDASRINLGQQYEIDYWCDKFRCSEKELRNAVKIVGTYKEDVEKYLDKR